MDKIKTHISEVIEVREGFKSALLSQNQALVGYYNKQMENKKLEAISWCKADREFSQLLNSYLNFVDKFRDEPPNFKKMLLNQRLNDTARWCVGTMPPFFLYYFDLVYKTQYKVS